MFQLEKHMVAYLAANGIGTAGGTSGWGIFQSELRTSPITIIVVTESGGRPLLSAEKVEGNFFNFNVIVRGNAGPAGRNAAKAKADDIYELLKLNRSITVETDTYRNIRAITNVMDGGTDKNNCPIFSINFTGLY